MGGQWYAVQPCFHTWHAGTNPPSSPLCCLQARYGGQALTDRALMTMTKSVCAPAKPRLVLLLSGLYSVSGSARCVLLGSRTMHGLHYPALSPQRLGRSPYMQPQATAPAPSGCLYIYTQASWPQHVPSIVSYPLAYVHKCIRRLQVCRAQYRFGYAQSVTVQLWKPGELPSTNIKQALTSRQTTREFLQAGRAQLRADALDGYAGRAARPPQLRVNVTASPGPLLQRIAAALNRCAKS